MAESHHEQPSGFWTLTRPSKLTKRRNSDLHELHHKVFNISVVGLSGVEKDKGPIGIGKSCLCNRFVRSAADDYYTDHISVLSQSDFSGRVVNNDHWLYWGSVIKSCDGYDLAFNVIEQTEFVDDACFQPFKSGKTEPYFKRCANTKMVSAEKLMYICKNQLGIEREYEQRYLPDGKFNVDGFLCLFDVSDVQGRNIDKQIEMTNLIMLNLIKTKKPVVFVTTKHDEANELLVAEAERLVNQPDFRGVVPIVETSAQENVNINIAFLVCAQLIDKTRTKLRLPPYHEANKNHRDLLNTASEAYLHLLRSTVMDFRATWQQVCIKLSHNPEFLQYTYLYGLDKATLAFKDHVKRLRDDCISQKVQHYLRLFPNILNELIPDDLATVNLSDNDPTSISVDSSPQVWEMIKDQLRSHPQFNKYFISIPPGIHWHETEILQSSDTRIPSDWLDSEQAYSIFQQRNLVLETEHKRKLARTMFAQMLREAKIPVGQPYIELKTVFAGNQNLELLSDQELFEVYVDYQNNLLQQARSDFQELLLENAEHLQHLTSSNKVIRQEDIRTINAILQHDVRYQALDRFDQDRTLMMIRHLSFLHSQISEQCPSYPKCVEPEIERLLITKAKTLVSRFHEIRGDMKDGRAYPQRTCDLVILGPRRPSQQLILALNVLNSRVPKESQYQITFTVFDNAEEVDSQLQRFRKMDAKPKGCFGIFTNRSSLEHVNYTLEKFLSLKSNAQKEKNDFGSPPVVMLYAADITLDERTMLTLESEGQQVADQFKCPFMNVTAIDNYRQHQQNNILSSDLETNAQVMSECASLDYACVDAAFNVLKEAISRRVCFMELYNNQELIPHQAFNPDARILMCLLCGEPFSNERFLWQMFLDYEDCYVTSSKSICLKVRLDEGLDRFVEVVITSYTHGALNYREELLHGFILVCSIHRKASLSILNAFSFNIPCTPVLIIAIRNYEQMIKKRSPDGEDFDNDCIDAIEEAKAAASRLKGHFKSLDLCNTYDKQSDPTGLDSIRGFLLNVIKRKPIIEKAYDSGDNELAITPSSMTKRLNRAQAEETIVNERSQQKITKLGDESNHQIPKKTIKFPNSSDAVIPGKLDLRQFDNITNAIGKLNVQSKKSPESSTHSKSNSIAPQPPTETGFFKNRAKKAKGKLKDSKIIDADNIEQQVDPIRTELSKEISTNGFRQDSTELSSSRENHCRPESSSNSTKATEISVIARSSRFRGENDSSTVAPTIESTSRSPNRQNLPRPAPRSASAVTGKSQISTSPANLTSNSVSISKRLGNPRQNHGRAVAPPQLPGGPPVSFSKNYDPDSVKLVDDKSSRQSKVTDLNYDTNQSPIAQNLLRFSKDHKVSELNPSHDSDNEQSPKTNRQRDFKSRGQGLEMGISSPHGLFSNSPMDSSDIINARGAAIKQLNEILANKQPQGSFGVKGPESHSSSFEQELDINDSKKKDKDPKKDKKKIRDDEKMEKRRLKEEERLRRQEKKLAAKKSKSGSNDATGTLDDDGVPLFIRRCIEFIEFEGLDAEGIYRVPGNRAHVDAFVQKFKENPDMSIVESDIPVNAVATALKDFLSKKWGPIIPLDMMNELTTLSEISEKEERIEAVKQLVSKLPQPNYKLLRYVFSHFVKVSLNHSLNSMDSKNLAICWWPTLLPLHFSDMVMFEQMRPHLEESIQIMIDQYDYIFEDNPSTASVIS